VETCCAAAVIISMLAGVQAPTRTGALSAVEVVLAAPTGDTNPARAGSVSAAAAVAGNMLMAAPGGDSTPTRIGTVSAPSAAATGSCLELAPLWAAGGRRAAVSNMIGTSRPERSCGRRAGGRLSLR
jgi:hypothetical protein